MLDFYGIFLHQYDDVLLLVPSLLLYVFVVLWTLTVYSVCVCAHAQVNVIQNILTLVSHDQSCSRSPVAVWTPWGQTGSRAVWSEASVWSCCSSDMQLRCWGGAQSKYTSNTPWPRTRAVTGWLQGPVRTWPVRMWWLWGFQSKISHQSSRKIRRTSNRTHHFMLCSQLLSQTTCASSQMIIRMLIRESRSYYLWSGHIVPTLQGVTSTCVREHGFSVL